MITIQTQRSGHKFGAVRSTVFSLFHFYKSSEGGRSENTAHMQMLRR
jgi:hypothetical protein